MKSAVLNRIFDKYTRVSRETLLHTISKQIEQQLRDNIELTVYSRPAGEYERTYSMLNSIATQILYDNSYITMIGVGTNPDNMDSTYPSVLNPGRNDNREFITEWLNNGTNGSPYFNHNSWDFMGMTQAQVIDIVHKALVAAFAGVASNATSGSNLVPETLTKL